MAREAINVVWLKRDLRLQDHEALHHAEAAGLPYLILYCFEPSLLAYPDTSLRHLQFIYHSLIDLNRRLRDFQREVYICHAECLDVLQRLQKRYRIQSLFSYQESGIRKSWERDKAIQAFCEEQSIGWTEFQRDGIVRGVQNREGWDRQWYATMSKAPIVNRYSLNPFKFDFPSFPLAKDFQWQLESDYPPSFQKAGEGMAWKYLHSFLNDRGSQYHRHISKPEASRKSCSRLSPYLAWGNLSIRQVVYTVKNHPTYPKNKRPWQAMLTRLKWHCHFIQKFEMECDYETRCVNRGYESMPRLSDEKMLEAWKTGQTGYPMVDANMRCLQATGWINFRMRAMLVSFLCHHMQQDWRTGVYHLANLFLDYEPGIHYTQFQMQAGTTGINTVRMYNPVKQSLDHDPEAVFIKTWVPELCNLPTELAHQPWTMSLMEQQFYNFELGKDYPHPILDLAQSGKEARAVLWGHRKSEEVKSESMRILAKHTRRKKET